MRLRDSLFIQHNFSPRPLYRTGYPVLLLRGQTASLTPLLSTDFILFYLHIKPEEYTKTRLSNFSQRRVCICKNARTCTPLESEILHKETKSGAYGSPKVTLPPRNPEKDTTGRLYCSLE